MRGKASQQTRAHLSHTVANYLPTMPPLRSGDDPARARISGPPFKPRGGAELCQIPVSGRGTTSRGTTDPASPFGTAESEACRNVAGFPGACSSASLAIVLRMLNLGDILQQIKVTNCLELASPKGVSVGAYVQDMLVSGLKSDAKLGGSVEVSRVPRLRGSRRTARAITRSCSFAVSSRNTSRNS